LKQLGDKNRSLESDKNLVKFDRTGSGF